MILVDLTPFHHCSRMTLPAVARSQHMEMDDHKNNTIISTMIYKKMSVDLPIVKKEPETYLQHWGMFVFFHTLPSPTLQALQWNGFLEWKMVPWLFSARAAVGMASKVLCAATKVSYS